MTAIDYNEFVELAQSMISDYGQDVTWQSRVTATDPAKEWNPAPSGNPTSHVVKGLPLPSNTAMLAGTAAIIASMMYEKGQSRPKGDIQMLLPGGLPFEPKEQDTCVCSYGTLKVTAIEKLDPGGVPVLYWIQMGY